MRVELTNAWFDPNGKLWLKGVYEDFEEGLEEFLPPSANVLPDGKDPIGQAAKKGSGVDNPEAKPLAGDKAQQNDGKNKLGL